MIIKISFFLFLFFPFLLQAQEPAAEVAAPPAEASPAPAPAIPSVDLVVRDVDKMLEPFRYNRTDKRDPFLLPEGKSPLNPRGLYGPFLKMQEIPLDKVTF